MEGFCYSYNRKPFVDYWKRLKDVGYTKDQIEDTLGQLLRHWQDMAVREPGLEEEYYNIFDPDEMYNFFEEWASFYFKDNI